MSRLQREMTPQRNVPWRRAPGQCDDVTDLTRENLENFDEMEYDDPLGWGGALDMSETG